MRTLFVYLLTAVIVGVALFFGYPELFIDEEAAASADRVQGETPVIAARVGKAPFVETLDALGTVLGIRCQSNFSTPTPGVSRHCTQTRCGRTALAPYPRVHPNH